MIYIELKKAIEAYREKTGERLTYQLLSERTGLSKSTLQSLASRTAYNTTLSTVEKLCVALECGPEDLINISSQSGKET